MRYLGIYVRVSTEKQKQFGLSIDDQINRGKECAIKNGFEKFEIFQDGAVSGTLNIEQRPGLSLLMQKIVEKEIDGVFVTEWDRLSRGDTMQTHILKSIFKEHEIRVFENTGEVLLNDINQELLTDIKGLLAAFEVKKTSARIKAKLKEGVIKGHAGGGALLPYGYTKFEKKLVVDEGEAVIVKMIFEMSLDGKGTKVIANKLNEEGIPTKRNSSSKGAMKVRGKTRNASSFKWRDKVVYDILTNTMYKGQRLFQGKYYDCPPIIPEGMFDAVQNELKRRKSLKDTTNKYFYLLKGLIYCVKCESRMYGRKRENLSDNQYICSSQRHKGEFCGLRGVNIDRMNEYVWNAVMSLPADLKKHFDVVKSDASISKTSDKIQDLHKRINKLKDGNKRLQLLFAEGNGEIKSILETLKEREAKIKKYEGYIRMYEKSLAFISKHEDIMKMVEGFVNPYKKIEPTPEQKQNVVRSLIKYVVVNWNETMKKHFFWIEFKIDYTTSYAVGRGIDIDYKKVGAILKKDKDNTMFHFRRIQPHPDTVNDMESVLFGMRLRDSSFFEKDVLN